MDPGRECLALTITHSDDPAFSGHFRLQAGNDKDVVKIGRSPNAHIHVVREGISGVHVELRAVSLVPGARPALMARDLSKNGTGVNFAAGEKKPLKNGVDMLIPDRTSLLMPIFAKNKGDKGETTEDAQKPGQKRVMITISFDDTAPSVVERVAPEADDELAPPPPPPGRGKQPGAETAEALQRPLQPQDAAVKTPQSVAAPASEAKLTAANIEVAVAAATSQPLPQQLAFPQPSPQPAPAPQPALPPGPQAALQQLLQPLVMQSHSTAPPPVQPDDDDEQPELLRNWSAPAELATFEDRAHQPMNTFEDRAQQLNHLKQWLLDASRPTAGAAQPPMPCFPALYPTSAAALAVPDPMEAMSAWTREFSAAMELAAALEIARKESYHAAGELVPPIDLDMLDAPVGDAPVLIEDDPERLPSPFENPAVEGLAERIRSANEDRGGILVVLSVSGLLLKKGKKKLVPDLRPYLSKLLEVFDRFAGRLQVGVWSSQPSRKLQPLVLQAFGAKRAKRLAFVWDQGHCQPRWVPGEEQPTLCKDFLYLQQSSFASYAPDRVLIIDNDPSKLANFPAGVTIHPSTFASTPDNELKRLAAYVEGLAASGRHITVVDYVRQRPFLSRGGARAEARHARQGGRSGTASPSPSPEASLKRSAQQMDATDEFEAYWPDEGAWLPVTLQNKRLEHDQRLVTWADGQESVLPPHLVRRRPLSPRSGRMMYLQPESKKAARPARQGVGGEVHGWNPAGASSDGASGGQAAEHEWLRLASRSTSDYYYYHRSTGHCQLDPPAPWQRRSSRNQPGVFYYWNPDTGQSCTEKPDMVCS